MKCTQREQSPLYTHNKIPPRIIPTNSGDTTQTVKHVLYSKDYRTPLSSLFTNHKSSLQSEKVLNNDIIWYFIGNRMRLPRSLRNSNTLTYTVLWLLLFEVLYLSHGLLNTLRTGSFKWPHPQCVNKRHSVLFTVQNQYRCKNCLLLNEIACLSIQLHIVAYNKTTIRLFL